MFYQNCVAVSLIGFVPTQISLIYFNYYERVFLLFYKSFYSLKINRTIVLHRYTNISVKISPLLQSVKMEEVYGPSVSCAENVFKSRHIRVVAYIPKEHLFQIESKSINLVECNSQNSIRLIKSGPKKRYILSINIFLIVLNKMT